MTEQPAKRPIHQRIQAEMLDSFDEELELEIDDDRLDALTNEFSGHTAGDTIDRRVYFKELFRLQGELVKLQDWVQHHKRKVVVIFEGRDSAGKGGVIKRITQRLNPRVCRVAALPAPNERERTQWYFQRYVSHLPAGGEIVLFDRSWYNRAGVERVMGFCTEDDVAEFFRSVPEFERMLVRSGIVLIKYWFSITDEEQYRRFTMRIHDPLKQWKLSPMDVQARSRWEQYTKAKEALLEHTHPGGSVACDRGRRQEEGAAELHRASARANAVSRDRSRPGGAAAAGPQPGLSPRPDPAGNVRAGALLMFAFRGVGAQRWRCRATAGQADRSR
jgi:polyphosphate kinase